MWSASEFSAKSVESHKKRLRKRWVQIDRQLQNGKLRADTLGVSYFRNWRKFLAVPLTNCSPDFRIADFCCEYHARRMPFFAANR